MNLIGQILIGWNYMVVLIFQLFLHKKQVTRKHYCSNAYG